MTPDYPAAHSMDSAWFAVDKDGHVGHFTTGEGGAMPWNASLETPYALLDQVAAALPRTEVVYDRKGPVCPGPLGARNAHATTRGGEEQALLFLRSLAPVRREIERGEAVRVPCHGGEKAVVVRGLSPALVERLHRDGVCLGCFSHWDRDEEGPPDPATLGLFAYEHLSGNQFSGPYGLDRRPARPAHIDELPPALRRELREVQFPGFCFARRLYIQPIEHDQTSSTEPAYLTSDGKRIRENTEAIRDAFAPDTYAEDYEYLVSQANDWLKGITIDPPRYRG